MSFDPARSALLDIRDNIFLARGFVAGLDLPAFQNSRLHVYAATRAIEIISEASRRLSDELRGRHPNLPWRAIRDAGNFYRHQYDNVLESYVWTTIQVDLPPLLVAVEQELGALGDLS
jgi:uncharacterized protein with HEPN domain